MSETAEETAWGKLAAAARAFVAASTLPDTVEAAVVKLRAVEELKGAALGYAESGWES